MGVLFIAVLGLFLHETLQRVNALKTSLTAVVNGVAAVAFAFLGPVVWSAAVVLAGTTMVGGMLGAVVARRLSDRALRWAVVVIGLAAAVASATVQPGPLSTSRQIASNRCLAEPSQSRRSAQTTSTLGSSSARPAWAAR